jgi:hypothetical protein
MVFLLHASLLLAFVTVARTMFYGVERLVTRDSVQ